MEGCLASRWSKLCCEHLAQWRWSSRQDIMEEAAPGWEWALKAHGIPWVCDSAEWDSLRPMAAPLLSFLWVCSGSDAWAGIQEVWVPGQARRCLVECVNLWGLPPGSSAMTAWISLQGGEHTNLLLLQSHLCHRPHHPPPQIQSCLFYFYPQRRQWWGGGFDSLMRVLKRARFQVVKPEKGIFHLFSVLCLLEWTGSRENMRVSGEGQAAGSWLVLCLDIPPPI